MRLSWRYDGGFAMGLIGFLATIAGIVYFLEVAFGYISVPTTIDVITNSFIIAFLIGIGYLFTYMSHQMYLNVARERNGGELNE